MTSRSRPDQVCCPRASRDSPRGLTACSTAEVGSETATPQSGIRQYWDCAQVVAGSQDTWTLGSVLMTRLTAPQRACYAAGGGGGGGFGGLGGGGINGEKS